MKIGVLASSTKAWFGCASGCSGELPLNQVLYYCPKCAGLLDVQHDLAALRNRSDVSPPAPSR